MLTTPEQVDEKKLRGKAAEFIEQTGVLFVNGLYEAIDRTLDDIEPEYIRQQGDPEALRTAMINAARKIIFCFDHSKCGRQSLSQLCGLDAVDIIVTDKGAPTDLVRALRKRDIDVVLA